MTPKDDIGLPSIYVAFDFYLNTELTTHKRKIYNLLDLLGDFGGLFECIMIIMHLWIAPWSQFSFSINAIKKLYMAKTKDENLLSKP